MLSGSQKLSHRGRDVSSRSSSHVNAVASRLIFTSGSVCLSLLFYFPSQAVSLSFHLLRSMSWMTGVKLNGQGCETNFVCVCVCAHAWVCVHTLASCRWSIAHSALCCPSGTTTSLPACLLSSHNQFCNPTNPHTHAALRFFFFLQFDDWPSILIILITDKVAVTVLFYRHHLPLMSVFDTPRFLLWYSLMFFSLTVLRFWPSV